MSIANAQAEYIEVDGQPAIILVAKKTIEVGDEIRYDYGDKDRKTRSLFPFLAPGIFSYSTISDEFIEIITEKN